MWIIVASTATVRKADDQVRALYGRGVEIFPPQVLDVADTYFSRELPIGPDSPGRRYLGVSAQGVRLSSAEIRVAEVLLLAGQLLFAQAGAAAGPYMTLVSGQFAASGRSRRQLKVRVVRWANSRRAGLRAQVRRRRRLPAPAGMRGEPSAPSGRRRRARGPGRRSGGTPAPTPPAPAIAAGSVPHGPARCGCPHRCHPARITPPGTGGAGRPETSGRSATPAVPLAGPTAAGAFQTSWFPPRGFPPVDSTRFGAFAPSGNRAGNAAGVQPPTHRTTRQRPGVSVRRWCGRRRSAGRSGSGGRRVGSPTDSHSGRSHHLSSSEGRE
jgi:hypothetical protein